MVTPETLTAIVRAARPSFRSRHDRLAFAVHAFLLADGWNLVAVGEQADESQADDNLSEEMSPDGWNASDDTYVFRYADTKDQRKPLLVKALAVGDKLLVNWLALGKDAQPHTIELDVNKYTSDAKDLAGGYQNVADLISKLQRSFYIDAPGVAPASARSDVPDASTASTTGDELPTSRRVNPDADYDPLRVGPTRRPPPGYGIGGEDVVPPGVRPPGIGVGGPEGGIPSMGIPPGPGHFGGGMHVGPNNPIFGRFGGGRPRPGGPPGMGVGPGTRWDPIGPPGIPGWNPDDFQRGGPGNPGPGPTHPDLPRRGGDSDTDFDTMYM